MSRKLAKLVHGDLCARTGWESKQRVWYDMRHEGLRRKNKPFNGCADLHYPLGDGMIDKLKPFYWSQVFGNELIATFTSENPQDSEHTRGAAASFDYQLKEESEFFEEMMSGTDNMLMGGKAVVKAWWGAAQMRLEFDAIDAMFIIVPKGTKSIERADRITHVMQFSVEAYKRQKQFNQEEDVIKQITGKGISGEVDNGRIDQKEDREGFTHGDDDQIVLWEVYTTDSDGRIGVDTFAPCAPDVKIRDPFKLRKEAYPRYPFYEFRTEIKDKGFYAPRGVMERVGAHEAYLCRTWNAKADAMTWFNTPLYTHEGPQMNLQNVSLRPGSIVPGNLHAVQMGQVPFDYDQEMVSTRMVAEYQIGMPDFGTGQQINTKERKTATEVAQIGNLMGQSNDLRAQIFRRDLAKLYRGAWALLRFYAKEKLEKYYVENELVSVPPEAIAATYRIVPSGSADGWNKAARLARAQQRYATYKGDPHVNQGNLLRDCLEEDDPRLVKKLWVDPQTTQQDQIEDQADELSVLLIGFPARVKPADDHAVHVQTVLGFITAQQQLAAQGQPLTFPLTPLFVTKLSEHVQQHLQQLHQKDAKAANALGKQAQELLGPIQQQIQAAQQAQQAQQMAAQQGAPQQLVA